MQVTSGGLDRCDCCCCHWTKQRIRSPEHDELFGAWCQCWGLFFLGCHIVAFNKNVPEVTFWYIYFFSKVGMFGWNMETFGFISLCLFTIQQRKCQDRRLKALNPLRLTWCHRASVLVREAEMSFLKPFWVSMFKHL